MLLLPSSRKDDDEDEDGTDEEEGDGSAVWAHTGIIKKRISRPSHPQTIATRTAW